MAQEKMNFQDRVLELCSLIPKGRVSTYKEISRALGGRGQVYRAVGRALHENPKPVTIPCHRVVKSDGSIGGFAGGIRRKIQLLKKEGIIVKKGKIADFEKKLLRFSQS